MIRKARRVALVVGLVILLGSAPAQGISLDFVPSAQAVVTGNQVSVDLVISGLGNFAPPSLSTFDLNVSFNPALLSLSTAVFGAFLGTPNSADTNTAVNSSTPGVVNLFELSFLEANSTTCVFCLPPFLEDLQPSSFPLATLTFNTIATGTSSLDLAVNALGDANGDPLTATLSTGSITVSPQQPPSTVIPEPGTIALLSTGLVGLFAYSRHRRKQV